MDGEPFNALESFTMSTYGVEELKFTVRLGRQFGKFQSQERNRVYHVIRSLGYEE